MKRFPSTTLAVLGASALLLLALGACGDDTEDGSSTDATSTSTGDGTPSSTSNGPGGQGGGGDGGAGTTSSSGGGDPSSSTGTGSGGEGGGAVLPGDYDCSPPGGGDLGTLVATPFVTIPGNPMQLRQAPGDTDRFFVVSKDGVIHVVRDGAVLETPFLDISEAVQDDGEQGLLGLAFHPDYQTNGRFFVHYTDPETHVAEYQVSAANPDVADPEPVGRVIQVEPYQSNHNGGAVEIGPDGFLYASVGDGGEQGDPNCRAQDPTLRAGKILRADISTPGNYAGAANNWPGGDPFVFDVGFRNPWRISFDACTGDLWIADVGQNAWEEVSVHPAGAPASNFGWNMREGAHDYSNDCDPASEEVVEPILDYAHDQAGGNSITGGYVYRGSAIPALRGAYLFGDFTSGRVWSARYQPGDATPVNKTEHAELRLEANRLAAMGQDNSGEIYLLDIAGEVLKIEQQ